MPVDPSAEITPEYLRERSLADLLVTFDDHGRQRVEAFLDAGVEVADGFLREHEKAVGDLPAVEYDRWSSGVEYDPYHGGGATLIVGGPRGNLEGGYQVLRDRGYLSRISLLNTLTKGLLHAYNQQLVDAHFENYAGRSRDIQVARRRLYDVYQMLELAVDEGFTEMFSLYVDGNIGDPDLREDYIDAWAEWYRELADIDVGLFFAVARTISDRIAETEGSPKERIIDGLGFQEQLVREGDLSVLRYRSEAVQ